MHLLQSRGGTAPGAPTMVLQHREALIYTLGKAAALEQLVMCQYLYAAFSMKDREDEGLTEEQLAAVRRWRRELHPHRRAGDAPPGARAEPADRGRRGIRIRTAELPAAAARVSRPASRWRSCRSTRSSLRHFAFLERPEGLDMADQDAFAAVEKAAPLPRVDEDEIGAASAGLRDDRRRSTGRSRSASTGLPSGWASRRCSSGRRRRRRRQAHFRFAELVAVTDLASAHAAIDTIVEQGEGARGEWRDAHFGRLIAILDEYLDLRDADPRSSRRGRSSRRASASARTASPFRSSPTRSRPLRRPAQRGLRGDPPAAGALLRPHRRDRRSAGGPRRSGGRADARRRSSRSAGS